MQLRVQVNHLDLLLGLEIQSNCCIFGKQVPRQNKTSQAKLFAWSTNKASRPAISTAALLKEGVKQLNTERLLLLHKLGGSLILRRRFLIPAKGKDACSLNFVSLVVP